MTGRQRMQVRRGSDLGKAIAALRAQTEMSQADLADVAGLAENYISKIERGRTSSILEHELRILRRLGATLMIEFPDGEG
jgi:transcriptional regulator with XRE-family HTH domain